MSKLKVLLMAVAASGLFALAPISAEAQTGAISGVVTDAETGDALAGTLVRASVAGVWSWNIDFTDVDGAYLIDDLEPGTYEVTARRFGHVTATAKVTVADGRTATADFALEEPAQGTVTGIVTDSETGAPIERAYVVIGGWWRATLTNADGEYTFEDVLAGDRRIAVRKGGYYGDVSSVAVVDDTTTTHDVALVPLSYGTVSGTVTDSATGDPIEGAWVQVGWAWWNWAITGADGGYTIENVLAGERTIHVSTFGYYRDSSTVEVLDGATTTHDVALDPWTFGDVTGVVTDSETGDPIEGAWVQGPAWWHFAITNAAGEYTIEDILTGDYTLRVTKTGYYTGAPAVTITAGGTTTADVALDPIPFGGIAGVVTNAETGAPISGARVQVGIEWWTAVYTNAAGEYTLEDVVAGDRSVRVGKFFYYSNLTVVTVVDGETTTHDVALEPF